MTKTPAKLVLANGMSFNGYSFGYQGSTSGEVVFNTAMTGYPESLTDPSYRGQLLVLTFPMVGNYGVPDMVYEAGLPAFFESDKIHISGLIISHYSEQYSHWNASKSLSEWLIENKVPAIGGIDTRALTQIIRGHGAMPGKIIIDSQDTDWRDSNTENLVAEVSTPEIISYGHGQTKILLVDLGVKYNIIRHFLKRGVTVIRVPWDYDFSTLEYDGLFLSNGPGDPKKCSAAISHLAQQLQNPKPIFGICLGNQLMALASGADTYKLPFGHRSHNQPVIQVGSNKALVTSQNHGYAISNETLSPDWNPWFLNLNDNTNEGIRHRQLPHFSVQFHPEASSGPTDTEYLFDEFLKEVEKFAGR